MKLVWRSRKGNRSRANNDAMGCYQDDDHLVAVVVDASEKGPEGAGTALARFWATHLVTAIQHKLEEGKELSTELLMSQIKEAHPRLRYQHLFSMASYTLLGFKKRSAELLILHCGDCLVAIESPSAEQHWLIEPHHCSRQKGLEGPLLGPSRNMLTRSLKARRLDLPTVTLTSLADGENIWICTDGYWAEYLASHRDWNSLEDDASVLLLCRGDAAGNEWCSDSDNGFFYCSPGREPT